MSERGESLDPVGMLKVASWRKLRASRGRVQPGVELQNLRPPNMRVHGIPQIGCGLTSACTCQALYSKEAIQLWTRTLVARR